MRTAQHRYKCFTECSHRKLEFVIEDMIFLKVLPSKGIFRFRKKEKLSPRSIGPYKILDKNRKNEHRLMLPLQLSNVHDIFHVSLLQGSSPLDLLWVVINKWAPELSKGIDKSSGWTYKTTKG